MNPASLWLPLAVATIVLTAYAAVTTLSWALTRGAELIERRSK